MPRKQTQLEVKILTTQRGRHRHCILENVLSHLLYCRACRCRVWKWSFKTVVLNKRFVLFPVSQSRLILSFLAVNFLFVHNVVSKSRFSAKMKKV